MSTATKTQRKSRKGQGNAQKRDEQEAALFKRATEVIGNRDDAMRWMGTPVRALGYATPISLVHRAKGRKDVLAVLTRLEHGVW
jgi:putative toxin-antitoxin system antitoxin component (TIGR02293 family)